MRRKVAYAILLGSVVTGGGFAVWNRARIKEAQTELAFALGVFDVPFASTRGFYDDGKPVAGKPLYEVKGEMPGFGHPTVQDIFVVVHGLNNTEIKAENRFALARESLQHNGYKGTVIGFSWDGATNWDPFGATGYRVAKHNAMANAKNMAAFLTELQKANPRAKIRLLGYSMGARLIAESIFFLDKSPFVGKIASVHLVGAAIDDEHLQTNERYGRAIERHVNRFFNYYSPEDSKLGKIFLAVEADRAVGKSDLEEPEHAPSNYISRNVVRELKAVDGAGNILLGGQLGTNHSAYLGIRNDLGKWVDDGAMDVVLKDALSHP